MNTRHTWEKGTTLAEILTGLSLIALIMLLCARVFSSTWERYHVINVVQEVKLNGNRGMERFIKDFNETSINCIFLNTDPGGLTTWIYFPSRRSADGAFNEDQSGSTTPWKTWVIYYLMRADKVNGGNIKETPEGKPLYYLVRKVKDLVPKGGTGIYLDNPSEVEPEVRTLRPVRVSPATGVTRGGEVISRNLTLFSVTVENCGAQDVYKILIDTWGSYGGRACTAKTERAVLLRSL